MMSTNLKFLQKDDFALQFSDINQMFLISENEKLKGEAATLNQKT